MSWYVGVIKYGQGRLGKDGKSAVNQGVGCGSNAEGLGQEAGLTADFKKTVTWIKINWLTKS